MMDTPPLRIWLVSLEGDRRLQFATANAITLARRAGFERPALEVCQDTEALIQIGAAMRLLFSQGNPEGRDIAGQIIKRAAA
jgi:hypothetical protein